jgi:hypothetical protein
MSNRISAAHQQRCLPSRACESGAGALRLMPPRDRDSGGLGIEARYRIEMRAYGFRFVRPAVQHRWKSSSAQAGIRFGDVAAVQDVVNVNPQGMAYEKSATTVLWSTTEPVK